MNIKELLSEDKAVSPVIGVILMVAITVILAAVIGTFVLGLGDQVQTTAPQASFSWEFTDNTGSADKLEAVHGGGDQLSESQINITATGDFLISADDSSYGGDDGYASGSDHSSFNLGDVTNYGDFSSEIGAGTSIYVKGDSGHPDFADDTFRIVWQSSGGGDSATISKWSGPSA